VGKKYKLPRRDTSQSSANFVLQGQILKVGKPQGTKANWSIVVEGIRCCQAARVHIDGLFKESITGTRILLEICLILNQHSLRFDLNLGEVMKILGFRLGFG
jgi:hypothetical protein